MVLVVIPDDDPPVISQSRALLRLQATPDIEVKFWTTRPPGDAELLRRIIGAHSVINIRASTHYSEHVLGSASGLKHLALWGTGTDNVDLFTARRLGIAVTNTPNTATVSVAEHALALTLSLAHRIPELNSRVRAGEWPRGLLTQLAGKTMGLIGTGAVGARMAQISRAIGMRVFGWTLHPSEERATALGLRYVDLETLLKESDVISLHIRLSNQTRRMIGAQELELMKPTALFINTSRGALVDEDALYNAMLSGTIAGAGLDTFLEEPLDPKHPLRDLPNVIFSPHTAGTTAEALAIGLDMAVDNVLHFLAGRVENRVA
ncbi:MAG: glycerate dehydrogenase [Chloroflexi bacterium]|nr:glycerate dehydrogenase [Chloroflexota bacterium]